MNTDTKSLDQTDKSVLVKPLTPAKWKAVIADTEAEVKASIKEPDIKHYKKRHAGEMPTWLLWSMVVVLVVIAGFAFYISAGKQLLATAAVLGPVVTSPQNEVQQNIVNEEWASTSGRLLLGLGELGTIFFLAAASILPAGFITLYHKKVIVNGIETKEPVKINFYGVLFRGAGVLSAMIAIVANVSVAAWHWQETTAASVYTALITITPPVLVLAIGLVVERLLLMGMKKNAEAIRDYNIAQDNYNLIQRDPKEHPNYKQMLNRHIVKALYQLGKNEQLLSADRGLRNWAVYRELSEHNEEFDFSVFTQPPQLLTESASAALPIQNNLQNVLQSVLPTESQTVLNESLSITEQEAPTSNDQTIPVVSNETTIEQPLQLNNSQNELQLPFHPLLPMQ